MADRYIALYSITCDNFSFKIHKSGCSKLLASLHTSFSSTKKYREDVPCCQCNYTGDCMPERLFCEMEDVCNLQLVLQPFKKDNAVIKHRHSHARPPLCLLTFVKQFCGCKHRQPGNIFTSYVFVRLCYYLPL